MNGHGSKFGRKKEQALAALLSHRNMEESAKAAGISSATLKRWLQLPEFKAAYLAARREVVLQTNARMQANSGAAASVLFKLMADPRRRRPSGRVRRNVSWSVRTDLWNWRTSKCASPDWSITSSRVGPTLIKPRTRMKRRVADGSGWGGTKVTVTGRLSIRKRLARLEAVRQKQAEAAGREAFIVLGAHQGETHLEMTGSDGGRSWFLKRPGPGKQLTDFGEFALVVELTEDEARL
jgi:hypothetical protein